MDRNRTSRCYPTGPDQTWLPFPGGPAGPWIVLATDRRAERNAAVFAVGPDGRPVDGAGAEFASRAAAEAAVAGWRRSGRLDDSRWTYSAFGSS